MGLKVNIMQEKTGIMRADIEVIGKGKGSTVCIVSSGRYRFESVVGPNSASAIKRLALRFL
jgi:hypothetical protein